MAVNGVAADGRSIDALKAAAARDPKAAVREAAKQFEALFMQELVKSMRAATMSSGMLENSGTELGTEMLDTQWATQMTGLPGGLSDAIARQLEQRIGTTVTPAMASPTPSIAASVTDRAADRAPHIPERGAAAFVDRHQAAAKAAEQATGVPAAFMIGQAAHESGWGTREIRHADGSSSHNLFGIKAGAGWTGPTAEVTTTEYVNGEARKVTARFRAYASYDDAFRDYARLLKDSPRYQAALANGNDPAAFAQGLQRGGYATDPAYADKLTRVINTTLRLARAG